MDILYLLIAFSLLIAVTFLILFLRAVRTGQYDDGVTPAMRMLFDDEVMRKRHADRGRELRHVPGFEMPETARKHAENGHTITNR